MTQRSAISAPEHVWKEERVDERNTLGGHTREVRLAPGANPCVISIQELPSSLFWDLVQRCSLALVLA